MNIPDEYYTKEIEVKLTKSDIDKIIGELEDACHNLYVFLEYDKLIKKLREKND